MGALLEDAPVRTAAAKFPELVVEWLPAQGPFVANGEWCDITDHVVSGFTQRGRQYELDQFQAGTCSITLHSLSRLFDPENTAGPFYPWLVPMRQLRVSAVWSGTRYPIFRGYITDWGQTTVQDKLYETTIQAKDAFALFEQITLTSSGFAATVPSTAPTAWFRLNETDTVRVSDSTANGNYGLYQNATQGAPGLIPGDSDQAASFAHSLEERVTIQTNLATAYPFSVSAIVQINSSDPDGYKAVFTAAASGTHYIRGVVSSTYPGKVEAYVSYGGATRRVLSTIQIDDNEPHHVVWVFTSASSFTIYIDGVDCTGTVVSSGSPAYPSLATTWTIGNTTDLLSGDYGFGTNTSTGEVDQRGTIDEFLVWNVALDATAAAKLSAASKGWAGDDTGTRVGRILDVVNWPATRRDIATGASVLGPSTWSDSASLLSVLQSIADTEYGAFFISGDGNVVWRSRHYPYLTSTATTSQATFGDAYSGETLKYSDGFELTRDETLIRNPVYASRTNGITASAKDDAYIEKYGTRSWSAPTTQDKDDATVQDRAVWLVARYKELNTRLARLTIEPQMATALWPKALGLELGDRITVKRTPLGANSQITVQQIIESISHSFGARSWTTLYQGSPVDPQVNTNLILDDATYGALDSYRLAY